MCGDLATVLSVGEERVSVMGFERGSVVANINLLASADPLMEVEPQNVKRFRGGLVFKAHRLLYHSTLGLRVIKKKKESQTRGSKRCRDGLREG